jgi:hypothetical protein
MRSLEQGHEETFRFIDEILGNQVSTSCAWQNMWLSNGSVKKEVETSPANALPPARASWSPYEHRFYTLDDRCWGIEHLSLRVNPVRISKLGVHSDKRRISQFS